MYKIGELSNLLNVSEHTLRFYEKKGLIVSNRSATNMRLYDEKQKLWMEFILHMKDTGMSLDDLEKYITLWRQGVDGLPELLGMLYKHKGNVEDKLLMYQENMELVNKKIAFYEKNLKEHSSEDLFEKFISNKSEDMNTK